MRFFLALSFFTLVLGVHASSLDSREPVPHRLDVRDTSDVCASITFSQGSPRPGLEGSTQCICLSTLSQFLAYYEVLSARTLDYYTDLINYWSGQEMCVYPENSTPACVDGNPCGFTCTDGYTASPADNPTTCACSAPSVICNGQCTAAGACPSSGPGSGGQAPSGRKRRWVGSGSCTDIGPGWLACGILGGGPRAWECVNGARDLESCGGCMYPLTTSSPMGTDCSTLPGVADVSCLGGECVVQRCMPGYLPAIDGTSCVRKHELSQSQFVHAEDVPEKVYGLEHVPLEWY